MSERGVDLLEYTFFRNFTIMAMVCFILWMQNRNPVEAGYAMSEPVRKIIITRAFLGFMVTLVINACLTMIPFSLLVILFQTSPFWTSILSY